MEMTKADDAFVPMSLNDAQIVQMDDKVAFAIMSTYPAHQLQEEMDRRLADLVAIKDIPDDKTRVRAAELEMAVKKDVAALKEHRRPLVLLNNARLEHDRRIVGAREEEARRVRGLCDRYTRAVQRKAEEERQKALAEQRRKEAEEARRKKEEAEAEAELLKDEGKVDEADALIENTTQELAQEAAAPKVEVLPPPAPVARAAGERVKRTVVYELKVKDLAAVLRAIADNKMLMALFWPSLQEILECTSTQAKGFGPMLKSQGKNFEIPGFEVREKD